MTFFLWRAWNAGRERICDCGIAKADTHAAAVQIARMCLGGPHMFAVSVFEVEPVGESGSTGRRRFDVRGVEILAS